MKRDVAIVLSGGGINGVLMELGFLKRLQRSSLWPRVGWIIGTSAGALAGSLAALDRLDDLEEFLLALQADQTFRPNRLWRLPLLGLHEYALPERDYELVYSSRRTDAPELAQAILASAAISALVLPLAVGDRVATDGAWVRNFPLAHAYDRPEVEQIVAFRYESAYPAVGLGSIRHLARRLRRHSRLPAPPAPIAGR